MEIHSPKFRSPPPKPPRRRHSDQLLMPSGSFLSTRKKYVDEVQPKDVQTKIKNNQSAGGSLPPNWTTNFCQFQTVDDSSSVNLHLSSVHPSTFQKVSVPISSSFGKYKASVNEVTVEMPLENVNVEHPIKNHLHYVQNIMRPETVLTDHHSNEYEKVHANFDHASAIIYKNGGSSKCSEDELLKSFQKECHRRHHSDPMHAYLSRITLKSNTPKSLPVSSSLPSYVPTESLSTDQGSQAVSFSFKTMQCLYKEIQKLQEVNDKLWQHLLSVQVCLENCKKKPQEDSCNLSVSDVLLSIYDAQKTKEAAMEERLKVVLEERDAAVLQLENMVNVVTSNFEDQSVGKIETITDEEIKELLHKIEVTDTPGELLQHQRILLALIYRSKEVKQDTLSHELKRVVAERDCLLEKVKQLEDNQKKSKLNNDIWNSDSKHWENNLLSILCQVIEQRDLALSKVQSVEGDSKKTVNLQQTVPLAQHSNSDYEFLQKHDDSNMSIAQHCLLSSLVDKQGHSPFSLDSSDEVRLLKGKIMVLSKALEVEMEKRESFEDKCQRLERLVNVLRKKINGQRVGIPV